MKLKNFISLLVVSFLGFYLQVKANNVFLPKEDYNLSRFPPFLSNLLKEERQKQEKEELGDIKQVFKKVISSNDKQLEKQSEELLKDTKKLERFLSVLPKDVLQDNSLVIEEEPAKISPEISILLNNEYKDEQLLNKKVSLKLKKSDIQEAIELIGKSADLDFVVDSDVIGKVQNLNLKNVSVAAALNILLKNNKPRLALVKDLGVWRIVRQKEALEILKGRLDEASSKNFFSDFVTMNHAKWTESFKLRIERMWHGIIGSNANKDGYYLVFDDESRKIFFKGSRTEVKDFKIFLKEIDTQIPQVRIEARVIIASKDFEESFGLQISGIYNRAASVSHGWDYIGQGPVSTGGGGDFKPNMIKDWALNLLPATASQFLNIPFIFGGRDLNTKRLNLVLNAAENRNEIKTILKPSLLVNSEEPAEILVGEEVPIETIVQERIEGSIRDMQTINYKDLGMKLKVKPVVTPDKKSVFLDIFVEHSFIKDNNSQSFDAKKSIIMTTKSKNRVLLNSGQTTLIGGLITDDKRKSKNGVPVLQEIPLLGALFRGSKKSNKDEQLMIFISPTVVV